MKSESTNRRDILNSGEGRKYKCPWCDSEFYSISSTEISALRSHLNRMGCKDKCTNTTKRLRTNTKNSSIDFDPIAEFDKVTFPNVGHSDTIVMTDSYKRNEDIPDSFWVLKDLDSDSAVSHNEAALFENADEISSSIEEFGNDRMAIQDRLNYGVGNSKLHSSIEKELGSTEILQHQEMIQQLLTADTCGINIRSLNHSSSSKRLLRDTIEIFNFWEKLNISIELGDSLLKLIKGICDRNNFALMLPKTMKSIVKACTKNRDKIFPTKQFVFPLKPEIFGNTSLNGQPLMQVASTIVEIGPLIGKELMETQPENFAFVPDICRNENDEKRLFSTFSSGEVFENLHLKLQEDIKKNYSDTSIQSVVLALSISSDTTTTDRAQKTNCNALQLVIQNCCGQSKKTSYLGIIPEKFCYSTKILHGILKRRGFRFKKDRKEIIAYYKRQMKLLFVTQALQPLLSYQEYGFLVQVGQGNDQKLIRAFPFLVGVIADTLESEQYAGTSNKKRLKCRQCLQGNCIDCNIDSCVGEPRNDIEHKEIAYLSGVINELIWTSLANTGKKFVLSQNQLDVLAEADRLCIHRGYNPLYEQFRKQVEWGVNSMHASLYVDYLHTIQKGLVEYVIAWSLVCLIQVSRIDSANYGDNLSFLDAHISCFPPQHTLQVVRYSRFPNGISCFLKSTKSDVEGSTGTGFISGGLEAYKLSSLLLQMMLCIPTDGSMLPSDHTELFFTNNTGNCSIPRSSRCQNIQNVVLTAMYSAIDVCMYSNAPFMSDEDVIVFEKMISNSTFRAQELFRLNSVLSQMKRGKLHSTVVPKNFGGVKFHLLGHLGTQIRMFGKDKKSCDTELTEGFNKVLKKVVVRTTRQMSTESKEITNVIHRSLLTEAYRSMLRNEDVKDPIFESVLTKESLEFSVPNNTSYQILQYNMQTSTYQLEEGEGTVQPYKSNVLTWEIFTKILDKEMEVIDELNNLRLLKQLKCSGSSVHDIDPFVIHANPLYIFDERGASSVQTKQECFSYISVEVDESQGEQDIKRQYTAQVLSIVEERDGRERNIAASKQLKLVVCWLENTTDKKMITTPLPYTQTQYTLIGTKRKDLHISLIDVAAVSGPVFIFPIFSSIPRFNTCETMTMELMRQIKFYELPLQRVKFWASRSYDYFTHGNQLNICAIEKSPHEDVLDNLLDEKTISTSLSSWENDVTNDDVDDMEFSSSDDSDDEGYL